MNLTNPQLPTKPNNSYWSNESERDGRRDLARKIRARKQCQIALGVALFERLTGARPHIAAPSRRSENASCRLKTVSVSENDLL